MKPIKILFVFAVVLAGGYFIWMGITIYKVSNILGKVWSEENRIMRQEIVSPGLTYKVGIYEYDSGALGYTISNVSLVSINKEYPIEGNLFKVERIPKLVKWNGNHEVQLTVFEESLSRKLPKHETKDDILVKYELVNADK